MTDKRETNRLVRQLLHELVGDEKIADPLARVKAATDVIEAAEMYRFTAMDQARFQSRTWAQIGQAMRITGQAAGRLFRSHGNVDQRPDNFPRPGGRRKGAVPSPDS